MRVTYSTTMPRKIPLIVRPAELRYDQGEVLPCGAQYMRLESPAALRQHWSSVRDLRPYASCGTGASSPAMFLDKHEWIFAPTREALVAAVTRWDELGITPRWYDSWAEESEVHEHLELRRVERRKRMISQKRWSAPDEISFILRSQNADRISFHGFWRLANLPCGLTHFDWFSEQAKVPEERDLQPQLVTMLLQRLTFADWKLHCTQDDVVFFCGGEVDREILQWQRERDEGRDPERGA